MKDEKEDKDWFAARLKLTFSRLTVQRQTLILIATASVFSSDWLKQLHVSTELGPKSSSSIPQQHLQPSF
jgi:hypothetical protein